MDSEDCSRSQRRCRCPRGPHKVNAPPVPINAVLVLLEAEKYTVRQLWSKDYVEADQ